MARPVDTDSIGVQLLARSPIPRGKFGEKEDRVGEDSKGVVEIELT